MAGPWADDILLKITNIVVYLSFLGSNIYAVASPRDVYWTGKETYLTPAPWAFSIWSLIHLLLLGTIIYQFSPSGKYIVIDGISWRFPVLEVFSVIHVNLWAQGQYIPAFITVLLMSSSVTHIYYIIKKHYRPLSPTDALFVHLPFSLYHGWSIVLVFLTAFEAFGVNKYEHSAGVWTKVFVALALHSLGSMAGLYAYSSPEGDLPAAIAIAWSLWAIAAHQRSSAFIHWYALTFAIVSLIWVAKCAAGLAGLARNRQGFIVPDDAERAPLVGHS